MQRYGPALDWVATQIKDRGVMELERLATAVWVTRDLGSDSPLEKRASELIKLKPHVSHDAAVTNLEEADQLLQTAPVSS
jgi:hypothetical protein